MTLGLSLLCSALLCCSSETCGDNSYEDLRHPNAAWDSKERLKFRLMLETYCDDSSAVTLLQRHGLFSVTTKLKTAATSDLPLSAGVSTVAEASPESTAVKAGSNKVPGWPFPHDFRDPNSAWDASEKLKFLLVYAWCCTCIVVAVGLRDVFHNALASALRVLKKPSQDRQLREIVEQKLSQIRGPKPQYPSEKLVSDLFLEQARRRPEAAALVVPPAETESGASRVVTYFQLAKAVQQLAQQLAQLGLGPGCVVALSFSRSCAQVVAVFGVLEAGAGFLPMDALAPEERKRVLLADSGASALLADFFDPADRKSVV